jgi:Flp pilus assembly pilin Flp
MTELFLNAFFAVRGFHANLLERARTERGASMVEYALLVGLIAVVAVVAIAALASRACSTTPTAAWVTPPTAS